MAGTGGVSSNQKSIQFENLPRQYSLPQDLMMKHVTPISPIPAQPPQLTKGKTTHNNNTKAHIQEINEQEESEEDEEDKHDKQTTHSKEKERLEHQDHSNKHDRHDRDGDHRRSSSRQRQSTSNNHSVLNLLPPSEVQHLPFFPSSSSSSSAQQKTTQLPKGWRQVISQTASTAEQIAVTQRMREHLLFPVYALNRFLQTFAMTMAFARWIRLPPLMLARIVIFTFYLVAFSVSGLSFFAVAVSVPGPLFQSYKAYKSNNVDAIKRWFQYWILFGILTLADTWISVLVRRDYILALAKMTLYVYMGHPTYFGAVMVYSLGINSFLRTMEPFVEGTIYEMRKDTIKDWDSSSPSNLLLATKTKDHQQKSDRHERQDKEEEEVGQHRRRRDHSSSFVSEGEEEKDSSNRHRHESHHRRHRSSSSPQSRSRHTDRRKSRSRSRSRPSKSKSHKHGRESHNARDLVKQKRTSKNNEKEDQKQLNPSPSAVKPIQKPVMTATILTTPPRTPTNNISSAGLPSFLLSSNMTNNNNKSGMSMTMPPPPFLGNPPFALPSLNPISVSLASPSVSTGPSVVVPAFAPPIVRTTTTK